MKFVIVYDSVSKTRVTEKVAVMIQDGLKEKGIEAEALQVSHAGGIKIEGLSYRRFPHHGLETHQGDPEVPGRAQG